jgi:LPXTG-site transpeptidase (sortase) family protein
VKQGGNYTLPEDVMMTDGSVGVLSIPKLSLAVNVYETEDEMEAMTHGLAHFKTTSAWSGNIGICGHNVNFNLTDGYFKNIHTLQTGDVINYSTALGSRKYAVETVAEISETDWSYLGRTEDNRITLITCISGKPRSRLVVQAVVTA